jgi:two-component system chemotaxis response regulator CheB
MWSSSERRERVRRRRVLVIDDSALVRELLSGLIAEDPELEVVGTAANPYVAWEKIQRLRPDVLTLDVEMPRMDGLTFLEVLMRRRPMPVVMISSLTEEGAATTLRALELGAVDFVAKPKIDLANGTIELAAEILAKIRAAAGARVRQASPARPSRPSGRTQEPGALLRSTHRVIAIGASTGGTEALREVLSALPPDAPGVVVVQHMPEKFTRAFAERLNGLCQIRVKEAADGDRILPGHALIAAGNFHLEVFRSGATYAVRVRDGEPVNRHRPSVDVLFHSCAQALGRNAVGVILTGMGDDGARGLKAMRDAGAGTIAQDADSCVVFGMPREAIELGAAAEVLPLPEIASGTLRLAAT